MDVLEHNREAWNTEVANGNRWTIPVGRKELDAASKGNITIVLTPKKPVPKDWLGDIFGKNVLCLASGGGQQGPILAAAGAKVIVFDNSDEQLKRDKAVADEFDLQIQTVQGNMQDLSYFSEETFDMIIHPVSNCFIDEIGSVWKESYRVLKANGRLLSGFVNPISYMIDWEKADEQKRCELVFSIPYSDLKSLSSRMKQKYAEQKIPFEFGHSLTDQIQGQIEAGFVIAGFYEDSGDEILDQFTDRFIATKAIKLGN
jgi:SAM-dependent methyltransferase